MNSTNYGKRSALGYLLVCFLWVSVSVQGSNGATAVDNNVASGSGTLNFTCNPAINGAFPHPVNCEKFFVCFYGVASLFECGSDFLYDTTLQGCNYPQDVSCGDRTRPDDRQSTARPPVIECQPGTLYIPHPSDCKKFYQCSNGTPYLFTCPADLYWNSAFNQCDWPSVSNCRV